MRRLFVFVLALMLGGCSLFESRAERAAKNSPDYKAGYRDGCASASDVGANPRASGMIRDEAAYRTNQIYHAGWGTGYNACRVYQPSAAAPGRGPIADPTPGAPF
jgi:hypothetical protein